MESVQSVQKKLNDIVIKKNLNPATALLKWGKKVFYLCTFDKENPKKSISLTADMVFAVLTVLLAGGYQKILLVPTSLLASQFHLLLCEWGGLELDGGK